MAIQLPQGFKIGSVEPIDTRLTLTKEEMLLVNENIMPDKYLCVCKDDGKIYIFKKDIQVPSEETGKFLPLAEANNLQDKLVSGENIKTINGSTVLGEGNLEIDSIPLTDVEIEEICN